MPPPPTAPANPFDDPADVAAYAERPPRLVPGFAGLQVMARLLLAESVSEDGEVLVVGAGGGLELTAFAQAHPGWRFTGVDPSGEMLKLARATLGPLATRVAFHHGYVDTAPAGPFDAATALLVMHFVPAAERLRTLQDIRSRLKPGAPFVCAHLSFPQAEGERQAWLARYAAFAQSSGVDPAHAQSATEAITSRLELLDPAREEELLREAGFRGVEVFYVGFTFRGWIARA